MATNNEQLKTILQDAKLTCLSKFQSAEMNFGATNPTLKAAKRRMNNIFGHLDAPSSWEAPIPFDENVLKGLIDKVDESDPSDLDGFTTPLDAFLSHLEGELLSQISSLTSTIITSDFNQKVLDALLQASRYIGGRKNYFWINHQIRVERHPDFIPLKKDYRPAVTKYRKALENNEVQSSSGDETVFINVGDKIHKSTILSKFFDHYESLTNKIKARLPAPSSGDPIA